MMIKKNFKRLLLTVIIFIALFMLPDFFALAQEFTYDSNGSLISDSNKQISSIHYNHLNLVDTITYSDGRRIFYTYTGSGQKLRERTILSNGTVKQKRDYLGNVLYRNDTLLELKHEDGRSVPLVAGSIAQWEYQYHLKDHLGNVRSTLTTKEEVDDNTATFETEKQVEEQNTFSGYSNSRRVNSILFDHTRKGTTNYAQRLNGSANEKYGLSKSLSVMPGDTIRLETYAKYVDTDSRNWKMALTVLMSQLTTGGAGSTVIDGAGYASGATTPFPFAGLNGTDDNKQAGPKAYLNWLVFDRNFILKTGGYVKMSEVAKENGSNVKHEKLEKELIIDQPGYVYVYLSNEETTPLEVYFDDFSVTQVSGPVIQESDYDPFGLTFNEYSRENAIPNNFLYNGKELQKDFDLNWYDYGARMYDAALGRWHVIDPMAEKYVGWSPYNYVMNNPVKFVDPDGRDAVLGIKNNFSSPLPLSLFMNEAKLQQAWSIWQSTPEGGAMASQLINDHSMIAHIALSPRPPEEDGKEPRGGLTAEVTIDGPFIYQNMAGSFIVGGRGDFEVFNGLYVTKELAAGQKIFLIVVLNNRHEYTIALTIDHEVAAHVVGRTGIGEIDHFLYGGAKILPIYVEPLSTRAFGDINVRLKDKRPGSRVYRMDQQIVDRVRKEQEAINKRREQEEEQELRSYRK